MFHWNEILNWWLPGCKSPPLIHITKSDRPAARMKSVSHEANSGVSWSLLFYPILLFSLPWRSPDMTEILLTGILSLNSINQTLSPSQMDTNLSVSSLCLLFAPVPVVSLDSPVDVDGCGSTIT